MVRAVSPAAANAAGAGLIRIDPMELHADLSQRAVLDTNALAWLPSPMAGVKRRMLDRRGGGEEILVLEGTFSDEHGDYATGTYLRNPAGSSHAPFSEQGCTLLVKLQQMHPADQQRLVIDTTKGTWVPGLVSGLELLPLHAFGSEHVALVRWAPGTVLAGVFQDEHGSYPAGSWLRNPPGSVHRPWSERGCTIWVKTGHLPATQGPDGSEA